VCCVFCRLRLTSGELYVSMAMSIESARVFLLGCYHRQLWAAPMLPEGFLVAGSTLAGVGSADSMAVRV